MIEYTTRFDKTYVDLGSLCEELETIRLNLLSSHEDAIQDDFFALAYDYLTAYTVVSQLKILLGSQAPFIIAESLV